MEFGSKTLSDVTPTLADLRKLSIEAKSGLLLGRLAHIGKHDQSALQKGNLMLPGDPYALAFGYPDGEKTQVREHLLGAPWTKLVNEGFLVDTNGQGFHRVSEEGTEFLQSFSIPVVATPAKTKVTAPRAPRAFLSYSWDGNDHQEWVKDFASRLQGESGVEIIFDQWHLNPGDDKLHFMEQAVSASDFVIVICTTNYASRANKREGGVGYESMVITSELAEHILTNKFVPVLREGDFSTSLPIYLKSRMGVDLRSLPYSEKEYEKLLRVLHGEPIQPPALGQKPDFTKKATGTGNVTSRTASENSAPLLSPTDKRPNATAHARYDKPGQAGPWPTAHVRIWEVDGKTTYSFETSLGDEFMGSKDEVIDRFFSFNRQMLRDGYKRMEFSPGPDPDFSVLT